MSDGHTFADAEGENVVVTSGDVTSISDSPSDEDPVAAGGSAIALSLTSDPDLLNVAFVTGRGDVQIIQIKLADLTEADGTLRTREVVVSAELTMLSGDVVRAGAGAATSGGAIAVATNLGEQGDLHLSFADAEGDLQLIEANVRELLDSLRPADGGAASGSGQRSDQPEL